MAHLHAVASSQGTRIIAATTKSNTFCPTVIRPHTVVGLLFWRIMHRTTALGYSDYIYEDGTDWLVREVWHSAVSGNAFDRVRYRYANGRPNYVEIAQTPGDLSEVWSYDQRYLQVNWHGDLVRRIWLNGDGATEMAYDPWGNSVRGLHYYEWNGAWGYMAFGALQLYYVHGRWYNPDTGLWLSAGEKGTYQYNPQQDAVNSAWFSGTSSLVYNRPRRVQPAPKPAIIPRSQWGALEPGRRIECAPGGMGGACVSSGWAEGDYDPIKNRGGYGLYSDLQPGVPLQDVLDTIVIHHEGNNQGYNVQSVQRYHMFSRGYWDIGYHFIIGPAGTIYEGRDIRVRGAHVDSQNSGKVGVLFLGDFEPGWEINLRLIRITLPDPTGDDPYPTDLQVQSGLSLIRWLDQEYGIGEVAGHNKFDVTECPGRNITPFIPWFNRVAQER
jgi:hypothetical protein